MGVLEPSLALELENFALVASNVTGLTAKERAIALAAFASLK